MDYLVRYIGELHHDRPKIEIYFKDWCSFSQRALALLGETGAAFDAIDVTYDPVRESEMVIRAGATSVPQVFVDNTLIGGYTDLRKLQVLGRLEAVLGVRESLEVAA
jgi:glutaredoxin